VDGVSVARDGGGDDGGDGEVGLGGGGLADAHSLVRELRGGPGGWGGVGWGAAAALEGTHGGWQARGGQP
jgi:hypothetical protein